ncbi:MAG: hypothetical protein ABI645_11395 [Pseudomonadota bacterium]
MDLLRYGHDSFGAQVVNGVSWDLLPVAFGAGVLVVLVHLFYRTFVRRSPRQGGG